jgi:hypothetical protein
MPAIIGLYLIFPVLVKILTKFGVWALLFSSLFITYGSLMIAVLFGFYKGHGTDLFTFWVFQFSLGMILAHIRETKPKKLNLLIGYPSFLLGCCLIIISWAVRTYVPTGKVFNDSLTSVGIFLVLFNIVRLILVYLPKIGKMLFALSSQSFLMFLIHYPIMNFIFGPALKIPMNPIMIILLGGVYVVFVYYLAKFLSHPFGMITRGIQKKLVP